MNDSQDHPSDELCAGTNSHTRRVLDEFFDSMSLLIADSKQRPERLPLRARNPYEDRAVDWLQVGTSAFAGVRGGGSYQDTLRVVSEDLAIKPFLTGSVSVGYSLDHHSAGRLIYDFLTYAVVCLNGPRASEYTFEALYGEFDSFFRERLVPFRGLAMLSNFSMSECDLELGPGLRIFNLSRADRSELVDRGASGIFLPGRREYAIETSYEERVIVEAGWRDALYNSGREQAWSSQTRVLSALRYFRPGAVCSPERFFWPLRWAPRQGLETLGRSVPNPPGGARYSLDAQGCAQFHRFWKEQERRKSRGLKRLALAQSRLEYGYERPRPEDRIIDCVIGLEALLQPEGAKSELSYRVSLRGATLLGRSATERHTVFREIRRAYDLRSAIVHGEDPDKAIRKVAQEHVPKYLENLEDLLRRMIEAWATFVGDRSERDASLELDATISGARADPG